MLFLNIHPKDNVGTLLQDCQKGQVLDDVVLKESIAKGHKFALHDIAKGDFVIKYGECIGAASKRIDKGEWVHIHNIEGVRGRGDK